MKSHLSEHEEQVALMRWAQAVSLTNPYLRLLFAIPNGGKRSIFVAKKMKAEGVKAGVPDLFLGCPKNGKHGLFIEMKAMKNSTVSPEQKAWLEALTYQGYEAVVCKGWEAAQATILTYLYGSETA